jgi:hypothetical protein
MAGRHGLISQVIVPIIRTALVMEILRIVGVSGMIGDKG